MCVRVGVVSAAAAGGRYGFPMRLATVEQVVARTPDATLRSAAAVLAALERALPYARAGAFEDALVSFNKDLIGFEPVAELLAWFDPRAVNITLHAPEFLELALQEFGLLADREPTWAAGEVEFPAGFDGEAALAIILERVRAATGRPL